MKIKVFTLNENGKIELTKEELQQLLDEAASSGSLNVNTNWQSPIWTTSPYNPKPLEIYYDSPTDYNKTTCTNSEAIK